jgi:hypothetical protein
VCEGTGRGGLRSDVTQSASDAPPSTFGPQAVHGQRLARSPTYALPRHSPAAATGRLSGHRRELRRQERNRDRLVAPALKVCSRFGQTGWSVHRTGTGSQRSRDDVDRGASRCVSGVSGAVCGVRGLPSQCEAAPLARPAPRYARGLEHARGGGDGSDGNDADGEPVADWPAVGHGSGAARCRADQAQGMRCPRAPARQDRALDHSPRSSVLKPAAIRPSVSSRYSVSSSTPASRCLCRPRLPLLCGPYR